MTEQLTFSLLAITLLWSTAASPKFITAYVNSKDGSEVAVKLSIDIEDHGPVYQKFKAQVAVSEPRLCALAALRSQCLLAKQNLFPNVSDGQSYGLHLLFERPIPILTFHILGRFISNEFSGEAPVDIDSIMPNKRAAVMAGFPPASLAQGLPSEKIREFIQTADDYFAGVYLWSFERFDDVQDADEALKILSDLVDYRPKEDCIEPCGGFFKFASKVGYNGYAYCAFTSAEDIVSTPFNCRAVYFESNRGAYLAAFSSPYNGGGYGAGFEGLSCDIKEVKATDRLASGADTVAEVFSVGLAGISLQTRKLSDGRLILYGVRAFEPSRALRRSYEYTTATLTYAKEGDTSASLIGAITLTTNSQNVRDRKAMLEPDDQQLALYQERVGADLKKRLSDAFQAKVECSYQ